jgi:hypothetical protein
MDELRSVVIPSENGAILPFKSIEEPRNLEEGRILIDLIKHYITVMSKQSLKMSNFEIEHPDIDARDLLRFHIIRKSLQTLMHYEKQLTDLLPDFE